MQGGREEKYDKGDSEEGKGLEGGLPDLDHEWENTDI